MRPAFEGLRRAGGDRVPVRRRAAGRRGQRSEARGPRDLFRRSDARAGRADRAAGAHRPRISGSLARHDHAVTLVADRAPAVVRPVPQPVAPAPQGGTLRKEAAGFAAVGALGLAVDIGGYNALVFLGGDGWMGDQPLVAKTISLVAGTTVAYFGNRCWTYGDRPRAGFAREYTLYMALSGVALLIALACLGFSRYVLGLTSPLADNISANGIGLALGGLFRFLSYRRWVFPQAPACPGG
jgi:putative flippase GtrA